MTLAELFISGSLVILGPTEYPNAIAQVEFRNQNTNSNYDQRDYALSNDEVDLIVTFDYNVDKSGQDSVLVTPPIGWTCLPLDCRLTLMEGYSDFIYLFPWEGM